jgi:chemosensory pili system protein ChpE/L-lysine exporter family protein LysE/ArgO
LLLLVLGLVFNAAPGAVFAETVRQGVRSGYRPALAVQLGSLVGDARALLGLAGIGLVMQVDALRWPVGLAGAAYLLWLSWDSWQPARTEHRLDAPATAAATQKQACAAAWLSLTNPQGLAYWAAMGSALGAVGVAHPAPAITGCSSRDS